MDQIWFYCKPPDKNAIADLMCKAKKDNHN